MSKVKFKLGINEYLGANVIVTDYRRIADNDARNTAKSQLFQSCPAMAFSLLGADREKLAAAWDNSSFEELKGLAERLDFSKSVIALDKGLIDYLSGDELLAVISHERSHIINGDVNIVPRDDTGAFINIQAVEMRCDQYGAMLYGKDNMRNGIIKTLMYSASLISQEGDEFLKYAFENKDIAERLDALS